jgi:periplasmic divalent cation tolerance protein
MATLTLLYSPFPDSEAARDVAGVLIAEKLVACCNILPGVESHYLWEGQYTTTNEVILLAKTTPERLEKAKQALIRLHPYTCPAILSFEASANPEFAAWVTASTS